MFLVILGYYEVLNTTVAFYLFEIASIFEQILCNMESK